MGTILLVAWCLSACAAIPVTGPPQAYDLGMIAYSQGDYQRAERLFNQVIASHRGNPFLAETQWMLARTLEAQSKLKNAVVQYKLFVENYPDHSYRGHATQKIIELKDQLTVPKKSGKIQLALVLSLPDSNWALPSETWLKRIRSAGVDTLVVKAFRGSSAQASPGVFFRTEHAPVIGDGLSTLAEAAHRQGLNVFAWMSIRQMDWKLEKEFRWADMKYDPSQTALRPTGTIDLFQPDAIAYVRSLYRDLASTPIDGILFGDDLFYHRAEGLGQIAQQQFTLDFGEVFFPQLLAHENPTPSDGVFWHWVGWKSRKALYFLADLMQTARSVNPALQFGIHLSEETVLDPIQALTQFSQDLLEANRYALDYYIISTGPQNNARSEANRHGQFLRHLSEVSMKTVQLLGRSRNVLISFPIEVGSAELFSQILPSKAEFVLREILEHAVLGSNGAPQPLAFILRAPVRR